MADEPKTINLSGLLTLASISPQIATAAVSFESAYEAMKEGREDFIEIFDNDNEDLESFLQDLKALASSATTIGDEIDERINNELGKIGDTE